MDKDQMFAAIKAERHRLVDELDGLSDDQWNAASLCSGWRVRDVVGHLVSILEIPTARYVWGSIKARNFDTYSDRVAREFGQRDRSVLVSAYRGFADTRFAPPIIGPVAPLTDVLIHARDIERPLGLAAASDPAAQRVALGYVCGRKARGFVPPKRTRGLRFVANDLGWSLGEGPMISGSGEAILLAVTGRRVALQDLSGDGVAELVARLA